MSSRLTQALGKSLQDPVKRKKYKPPQQSFAMALAFREALSTDGAAVRVQQVLCCALAPYLGFRAQNILHTGDMRWHPRMGKHPALAKQRVDQLFLDTTYASPKHTFPSQVGTCQSCAELAYKLIKGKCLSLTAVPCATRSKCWGLARSEVCAIMATSPGVKDTQAYGSALFVCVQLHPAELLHFHGGRQRLHSLEHPACLPAALCYATVPNCITGTADVLRL